MQSPPYFSPRFLPALLVLVALLYVPVARGECADPQRPYDQLCSGHGVCTNNTCLCDPGFGGVGYFTDRTNIDCDVHDVGFLAVSCLPYAVSFITCLMALAKLHTLGRLQLFMVFGCNRPHKGGNELIKTKTALQRACLTVVMLCLLTFAHYSLVIFWKYYVHNSLASCLTCMACSYFLFYYAWQRGRLTVKPVLRIFATEYKDAEGFRKRLERSLGVSALVVCLIQSAALLGVFIIPSPFHKQYFVYGYYATFFCFGVCWAVLVGHYYGKLIAAITEHMQKEDKLSAVRPAQRAKTLETFGKLRRLRFTLVLTMVMMCIISVLCIAMPVAATYLVPLYAANGAVSILGFLREITKMEDDENPSTASSTALSHGNSRSNGPTVSTTENTT